MKTYFFALFFAIGVLSQLQNNINNQTVQYSLLKDPSFGKEKDFRAQTIRVYDIVSQMLPDIDKPLEVAPIFPSEAILPPLNTVSIITSKQNELKTEQNVQPQNSIPNTNILQTPIQPPNNQIVLSITNQTNIQQPTIIPTQSPVFVSPSQLGQKTTPPVQNTTPLSTITPPSNLNKSLLLNTTSSLTNQSIISPAAVKQNYPPIVSIPPKTQTNTTNSSSPLNPPLITKQINEPPTALWKGVPSTTTKQNNFKKFTNSHQPSKNNYGKTFQHPSFQTRQQPTNDKQDSSTITIILFTLIGITVITIFGVGCIVMRKRRGKPVLFVDSTAIRQQIQTPKINKKGQYNPSEHQFIQMVQDSDMTHG